MLLRPSGRSTDLSKSNSASAWITTAWRTEAGAGRAAGAGVAGAAGAAGADGAAGAVGAAGAGAARAGEHSGRVRPEVTTQAPEASLTARPEASSRFGPTLAYAEPAASAIEQSVSPSEEIFIFGTPKRIWMIVCGGFFV